MLASTYSFRLSVTAIIVDCNNISSFSPLIITCDDITRLNKLQYGSDTRRCKVLLWDSYNAMHPLGESDEHTKNGKNSFKF